MLCLINLDHVMQKINFEEGQTMSSPRLFALYIIRTIVEISDAGIMHQMRLVLVV